MGARVGRIAASAVLAAGVGFASTAIAAPVADAAQPVIVGSCNATVTGSPGEPVSIDLGAVLGIGKGPVVPIGAIPQAGARALNPAGAAKAHKGPLADLIGGINSVLQKLLTGGCSIMAKTTNAIAAPIQDAGKPVTDALAPASKQLAKGLTGLHIAKQNPPDRQSPGNPGGSPSQPGNQGTTPPPKEGLPAPPAQSGPQGVPAGIPLYGQLGYGSAAPMSPASLYSAVPMDAPGFGVGYGAPGMYGSDQGAQYGSQIPGNAPSFGQIPGQTTSDSMGDPVRTAGRATALAEPVKQGGNDIGVPLLIAVIAATGVTAGLARAWVMKKATR
ncbi:hypothetical protein [Sciscionella marina]|uniref:hypothetical protein n=1 Tax=Sciscionella marina TaxID=508770 RepID=UPI000362C4B2|nr:hypothetical protein [Sciscionella marina]